MIFGKKNKDGNMAVNLMMVDGLANINKGMAIQVSLNDETNTLIVKERIGSKKASLSYDKIVNANVISEKEILESDKSVVGRAVVGGVLLGPLGAIVGGMTGLGKKQKSEKHFYMVVNYKSDDEVKALSFEIVGASLHWSEFLIELRKRINVVNIENEIIL